MIPKKIHYCWIGGNPLPDSAKKCIASWKKYCSDYEIIEWNENNYDFTKNQYMREAFEAKKWGFVPDYARLDIIYTYGGIYLDTDVEIIRPFDTLLSNHSFAGFETNEHINFGLGFAAEAGNPVIKKLLDSYDDLRFVNDDGTFNMIPSPQLNTLTLDELGLKRTGEKQVIQNCFTIYPTDYFCPKSFDDGVIRKTKNTYSIHHFDATWYTDDQQKEKQKRWKAGKKNYQKIKLRSMLIKVLGEKLFVKIRKCIKRR